MMQLVDWIIARTVFGFSGCNVETNFGAEVTKNAWAIAKIHKVRNVPLSDAIKEQYNSDFLVAEAFLKENLVQDLELSEQLKQKQVNAECIAFIEHLLTVDPEKRPSVDEALAHPYLQD